MKVGNPKLAIALSIAALGAIVFFLLRLIPGAPGITSATSGVRGAEPTRSSTMSGLPDEVLRDAFSHPALTKRYLATLPAKAHEEPTTPPSPDLHLFGELPIPVRLPSSDREATAEADGKRSEIAGIARQQDKKQKSKIELKGIMRATTPVALVTIDGHQDITVGLGEYIDASYRITQFSQNAVQISSDTQQTWLYVGHQVTEK